MFVAALWVFGSTITSQLKDVIKGTPAGFKLFMAWVAQFPYAQKLLEQVRVSPHGTTRKNLRGDSEDATELGDPAGDITEKRMSNVFKFDPNAIRERRRLNDKSPPKSAKEAEEMLARKDSRRAWLLFVGAAILLTILKTLLHIG